MGARECPFKKVVVENINKKTEKPEFSINNYNINTASRPN